MTAWQDFPRQLFMFAHLAAAWPGQTSFLAIFASKSSRCVVSPVPQLPPPLPWSCGSSRRENADCAPFIAARGELMAALASARWPLPMDMPLNAFTFLPGRYGLGFAPKLYRLL